MQIIYAAPFILLSLICFAAAVGVPSWRKFALPALFAPVAFGFCSLTGWMIFILVGESVLHLQFKSAILITIAAMLFYVLPGALGAWLSTRLVRLFERTYLSTRYAKDFAIRCVVSFIAAAVGLEIGVVAADTVFPADSVSFELTSACVCAGLFAATTFIVVMRGQRRNAKRIVEP